MILQFVIRAIDALTKPRPAYKIKKHWLEGPNVVKMPIDPSWYYAKLKTASGNPEAIVMHETATKPGTAINMAKNRQRKRRKYCGVRGCPGFGDACLKHTDRAASWHVSVEQDGTIVQMAPFNVGCWHAGGMTARAIPGVGKANYVAIGIERVGFEKDKSIPEPQIQACIDLIKALAVEYGITREHFVGHKDLDPKRKIDPGPAWMAIQSRVLDAAFPSSD
jgi:N-acetylmuramoyl-L-alanine amidase CwlA